MSLDTVELDEDQRSGVIIVHEKTRRRMRQVCHRRAFRRERVTEKYPVESREKV